MELEVKTIDLRKEDELKALSKAERATIKRLLKKMKNDN